MSALEIVYPPISKIAGGVPQKPSLSLMLFILYLNVLPSAPMITTNHFEDGTMFLYSSLIKYHTANKLQQHLDDTIKCLRDWSISINASKSVAVIFGDKTNLYTKPLIIINQNIECRQSVKYLEVEIDTNLTFAQHIIETCNKARGIQAALYPMLCFHSPFSISPKIIILQMYLKSDFTYASSAWGAFISKQQWKRLEAIHNVALQTITGTLLYVWHTVLHRSTGFKTIQ